MRTLRTAVVALAAFAGTLNAQDRPGPEVGTTLGLAILSGGGSSITFIGVPGAGIFGQPMMHLTFPSGSLLLEPQLSLNMISGGGETVTLLGLAGQVGYAFQGTQVNSVYIAGNGALQSASGGGESESDFGLGAAIGYRVMAGTSGVVRFEGRVRRWLDSELTEFTLGLGIALRLR